MSLLHSHWVAKQKCTYTGLLDRKEKKDCIEHGVFVCRVLITGLIPFTREAMKMEVEMETDNRFGMRYPLLVHIACKDMYIISA